MGILKNKYELGRIEVAFIIIILLAVGAVAWFAWKSDKDKNDINSFADCVAAGNPVMESYPEQCAADGKTFTNPDQQAQTDPNLGQDADAAITSAAMAYCQGQGTSDVTAAQAIVATNMSNPSLYVKADGFARLSMACAEDAGGFRLFFREQSDKSWKVLGGTQMDTLSCDVLDGTGISEAIASTCYGETGEARAIQPAS